MRLRLLLPPTLLAVSLATGSGGIRAAGAAEDPAPAEVYYSVEENGGVTLSNRPRHPLPRQAVIHRGPVSRAEADTAPERPRRRADIPVLEICTEEGRSVACEPR